MHASLESLVCIPPDTLATDQNCLPVIGVPILTHRYLPL